MRGRVCVMRYWVYVGCVHKWGSKDRKGLIFIFVVDFEKDGR